MQKRIQTVSYIALSFFGFLLVISLMIEGPEAQSVKYAFFIFGIRFFSSVTFQLNYLMSSQTFPTLVTGLAFTVTNTFGRAATLFAPIVAERMDNPTVVLVIGSAISAVAFI